LQAQYEQQYGPGNYIPNVFIQYWSMRVMAYGGALIFLISLIGGYLLWRGRLGEKRWFLHLAVWVAPLPFIMNIAGWMLTENGRQPWIVQGLQLTRMEFPALSAPRPSSRASSSSSCSTAYWPLWTRFS
jgi:cytochrome d ubiquinol oxidase subunit I